MCMHWFAVNLCPMNDSNSLVFHYHFPLSGSFLFLLPAVPLQTDYRPSRRERKEGGKNVEKLLPQFILLSISLNGVFALSPVTSGDGGRRSRRVNKQHGAVTMINAGGRTRKKYSPARRPIWLASVRVCLLCLLGREERQRCMLAVKNWCHCNLWAFTATELIHGFSSICCDAIDPIVDGESCVSSSFDTIREANWSENRLHRFPIYSALPLIRLFSLTLS